MTLNSDEHNTQQLRVLTGSFYVISDLISYLNALILSSYSLSFLVFTVKVLCIPSNYHEPNYVQDERRRYSKTRKKRKLC